MANVYRRGTKSVHIGTRRQLGLDVETVPECAFDKGGGWGNSIPEGPRCEACFGGGADPRNRRRPGGRTPATVAGLSAAALAAAIVVASSVDEPVNYFPTSEPSFSGLPSTGPSAGWAYTSSPTVTPGPSPSGAPVLTPRPTPDSQLHTDAPRDTFLLPTYPPIPTYPPLPTFGPLPTPPPIVRPTLPPLLCRHPGEHVGVKDICQWPGNR